MPSNPDGFDPPRNPQINGSQGASGPVGGRIGHHTLLSRVILRPQPSFDMHLLVARKQHSLGGANLRHEGMMGCFQSGGRGERNIVFQRTKYRHLEETKKRNIGLRKKRLSSSISMDIDESRDKPQHIVFAAGKK